MLYIAAKNAGLGNRIKCIVACMRFDESCKVLWDSNYKGIFIGEYEDLFKYPLNINLPIPKEAVIRKTWRLPVFKNDPIPKGFSNFKLNDSDPMGRDIDLEYDRIPKDLKDLYSQLFQKIQFSDHVLSKVNEFSKNFNSKTISVHIRSWWRDKNVPSRQKHFNKNGINRYIQEINKYHDCQIFVCSDYQDNIIKLTEVYGDKIISRNRHDGIDFVEDLIDLILLSKNKTIIGSYLSTFTEVAWWLSKCESNIVII